MERLFQPGVALATPALRRTPIASAAMSVAKEKCHQRPSSPAAKKSRTARPGRARTVPYHHEARKPRRRAVVGSAAATVRRATHPAIVPVRHPPAPLAPGGLGEDAPPELPE